jgi:amidase
MDMTADSFDAFILGARRYIISHPDQPLTGLTFAAKDIIDVQGDIAGCGNPDWRRTHAPAARNALVVDRLLRNGASLVGRTVTDELAFSLEGANVHDGTPTNPKCPDRLPGGSSSGSAVAVAAGLVDFALGTDTGGSVRVPASFCGIFGFRPSHGRISVDGVMPFAPSYDTIGWFARSGNMLALVGRALLSSRATPVLGRLLLARDAFALLDADLAKTLSETAAALNIEDEINLFGGQEASLLEAYCVLQGREIWSSLGAWIMATKPAFGDAIAARFADAATITAEQAAAQEPLRRGIAARLETILVPGVGIVLPTASCIAPLKSASADEISEFYRKTLTLTCAAGHAGLPQVSLPLASFENCPAGLSVIAARGCDESLLALAERIDAGCD